MRSAIPVQ